ncbi:hypothetical protein I4U23_016556 [Adineta vaga]|nr:hypothetical protein I4U23_016556 [Adineta vaga]
MDPDHIRKIITRAVVENIRQTLSQDHYSNEIDSVFNKLIFNIIIMGSPRVGKSSLINALCGVSIAETSSSLDACTQKVQEYVLKGPKFQIEGLSPSKINIFDTPDIDPMCLIFCASPGCFSPLAPLRNILTYCHEKHIICALICTNMWSGKDRRTVIEEFRKELKIFGNECIEKFNKESSSDTEVVRFFGNGALCMMVNSIEYEDNDLDVKRPVQGVDEFINSIMELTDGKNLLGWCTTTLNRRSFWEKLGDKTEGFWRSRFTEILSIREKSAAEIGFDVLDVAIKSYLNAR